MASCVSQVVSIVTGHRHQKLVKPRTSNEEVTQIMVSTNSSQFEVRDGRNLLGFAMCVRSPTIFKKSPLRTTFPSAQYRAPGSISLFTSRTTSTAPPCGIAPGLAPCGSLISVGPEICKLLTLSIRDIVYLTHFCRSVDALTWKGANGILTNASPIPVWKN